MPEHFPPWPCFQLLIERRIQNCRRNPRIPVYGPCPIMSPIRGARIRCAVSLRDSGGYCGGVPPLPIPNREVKPACADGTAMQCGRVGDRPLSDESPPRGSMRRPGAAFGFLVLGFLWLRLNRGMRRNEWGRMGKLINWVLSKLLNSSFNSLSNLLQSSFRFSSVFSHILNRPRFYMCCLLSVLAYMCHRYSM